MVDPGGSMWWLLIVPLSSSWGIQILNLGGSQELILVDPNVGSLTRTDKLEALNSSMCYRVLFFI